MEEGDATFRVMGMYLFVLGPHSYSLPSHTLPNVLAPTEGALTITCNLVACLLHVKNYRELVTFKSIFRFSLYLSLSLSLSWQRRDG